MSEERAKYKDLRVLVVEDEEFLRTLTVRLLNDIGVLNVLSAGDGLEALEILRAGSESIDLVVCDLDMPRMDGLAFLDATRQAGQPWSSVPTIILTVYRVLDVMNQALERGAFGYLAKPMSRQDMVEQLNAVLAQRR
ncbi:Regulator [Azospirillaceae bacterium]